MSYAVSRVSRNIIYNGLGQGLSVLLGFVPCVLSFADLAVMVPLSRSRPASTGVPPQ
jgi:hypothetical protein